MCIYVFFIMYFYLRRYDWCLNDFLKLYNIMCFLDEYICHTWSSPEAHIYTKMVKVYIRRRFKTTTCTISCNETWIDATAWFSYALHRQWKIHSNEVVWAVWWWKGGGGGDKRGNVGSTGWGGLTTVKSSFTWRKCPLLFSFY